ncbi:hypothetical protein ACFW04_014467 [Cataglyphis niger]
MNESRKMSIILHRMFSKKYFKPFAGVRSKMQIIKQNESDINIEHFDNEDLSEFEADFMNVGESHKIYEREMRRNKEHLKQQITNQKYFKEKEPRFLTFAERQLICKLYESNSEEWTIERLSESFPVLPETIQKILHANWSPKSVEKVMQYDDVVVENWKKFRAGKLPVSARLNEHLMKFKSRKIIMTDRESLAKQFVRPAPKFKEPKSQLFSNIIQSYLDRKQDQKLSQKNNPHKVEDMFAHSNKNQNLMIADNKTESDFIVKNSEKFALNEKQYFTLNSHTDSEKHNILSLNKKKNNKKLFTFDEFVKAKLEDIQKESSKEDITLLNLYRKQMEASQEMQLASDAINNMKEDTSKIIQKSNESISIVLENKDDNIVMADDNLIDTNIKVWNKKTDTECDYAKPIKISKNLYKRGMTYRISDCYYDDDGEFLYRIPGIQT